MSDLFKAGVSRKSEQLRKVLLTLDKLLADIKNRKDLVSFGRKYPAHLDTVKSDLKQARQLLYGVGVPTVTVQNRTLRTLLQSEVREGS